MLKKMLKKIGLTLLILAVTFMGFLDYVCSPTPNFLRNNTVHDTRLIVDVPNDERLPIIRTFEKKVYDNLSKRKIEKTNERIAGKVEGDIPSLSLKRGNQLHFTFEKNGQVVTPKQAKIKIKAYASHYYDPIKTRYITGTLTKETDGTYTYPFKRYSAQYEQYFLEYLRIEVTYTIDEKDFVSVFGIFQDNVNDGVDFFDNKTFDTPIPPEN